MSGAADPAASLEAPILEVESLTVDFGAGRRRVRAVDDVSFSVSPRETVAIVGESGSGKTTVARACMGLVNPPSGHVQGSVRFTGQELLGLSRRQLADVRGYKMSMIFQEPIRSLNPAFTVGDQVAEVVRRHLGLPRQQAWRRAVEAMRRVRIPNAERLARRYPFEFSGGMCQRVMIAMAVVCEPAVLIADEPTTALDVTVQARVLDLLKELQDDLGLAMLFITHDLGVVADIADRVMVMYAGEVVESGQSEQLFFEPQHPYTAGLLDSIPSILNDEREFRFIPGRVPPPGEWEEGCRFASRCQHAAPECRSGRIELRVQSDRDVRCVRADELELVGVEP